MVDLKEYNSALNCLMWTLIVKVCVKKYKSSYIFTVFITRLNKYIFEHWHFAFDNCPSNL